jgi:hypothetical protein
MIDIHLALMEAYINQVEEAEEMGFEHPPFLEWLEIEVELSKEEAARNNVQ